MSYFLSGKKQINKSRVLKIWRMITEIRKQDPDAKRFSKQEALDMHIEKGHEIILKELESLQSSQLR
jgi:hypothetical protein